jgi:hypothetical protein
MREKGLRSRNWGIKEPVMLSAAKHLAEIPARFLAALGVTVPADG